MRYGKGIIYLFTAVFLALALFCTLQEPEAQPEFPLSVAVSSGGVSETILGWEQAEGEYVFFLPSYAELSRTTLQIPQGTSVSLDGQVLAEGSSCDRFQPGQAYSLTVASGGERRQISITLMQSARVPAMYIDTQSGSMEFIHMNKGNEEPGSLRLYSTAGELQHQGSMDSLNGRGNVTWSLAQKKSYSLKLTRDADLLEMGQAQKWILLSDIFDASHIRNKVVYDLAQETGLAYSPDCAWVDLYLNGEYAGLYLLTERNEVHAQRVAISQENSFLVSAEIEQRLVSQNYPFVSTPSGAALRIHHSSLFTGELEAIWASAENAILSRDGIDPTTGKHFTELIDLESWAKKYLIEELFGNVDAAISQFFYYQGDSGKIFAGPVWDYDSTMGSYAPNVFFANKPDSWYHALYEKPQFRQLVTELYRSCYRPLLAGLLEQGFDGYAARIRQAAALDQLRWNTENAAENTDRLKSYMSQRMAFLDSLWLEGVEYRTVLADFGPDTGTVCYAVLPGTTLEALPGYEEDPNVLGWYYVNSEEPFEKTRPITQDMEIELRSGSYEDASLSGIHYVPCAAAVLLLVLLFLADFARAGRRRSRERTKTPQ